VSINLIQGPGYCYFIGSDGVTQYGLTQNGYVPVPLTEWLTQLQTAYQSTFGPNINLQANAPDGQRIAIEAEMLTVISELDKAGYDARFPDTATGQSLANVCSITGFSPLPPTASNITLPVNGTPGTVIPDSFQAYVQGVPTSVFQILPGQFYTVGAGGTINVEMVATVTGPILAPAGTAMTISTPVAGITSLSNVTVSNTGSNLETEVQIRQRRLVTLSLSGPNVLQIETALLELAGVTNVGGSENQTDFTNASGLPPHSMAFLVSGTATSQAIATVINSYRSAGINTYGNISVVIVDSQGTPHTVYYSTPSQIETYFGITVTPATNPLDGIFPTNGAAAIQQAVLTYIGNQMVGQDVVLNQLSQYICSQVSGIVGIAITAGLAPSPVGTANLSMLYNQLAVTAAGNISVTT